MNDKPSSVFGCVDEDVTSRYLLAGPRLAAVDRERVKPDVIGNVATNLDDPLSGHRLRRPLIRERRGWQRT